MSALSVAQVATAISPGISTSFQGLGGTAPYVYTVLPGGAGGTIDSSTGLYMAPASIPTTPQTSIDMIQVTDATDTFVYAQILICTPLELVCDIIRNEMNLDSNHVYLWDQKILQPTDSGLYVVVSVARCKPFGNNIDFDGSGSGLVGSQSIQMMATLDLDIISRGPAARDQKEFVVMALQSVYSIQQQEANSFSIGRLPAGSQFINLSNIDGAAIPYRFRISVNIQYTMAKNMAVPYFNDFSAPTVVTNP